MKRTTLTTFAFGSALLLSAAAQAVDTSNEGPNLGSTEEARPAPSACTADFDGNNEVNFGDFLHVISNWGQPVLGSTEDERIGFAQMMNVINNFGSSC